MEEISKILDLKDYEIEQYVESRIKKLDSLSSDIDEVAFEEREIYK